MNEETHIKPEFSVEVDLTALPRAGKNYKLKPDESECREIAKRLGVLRVEQFEGETHLSATKTVIKAAGSVRAVLTRECIASLEEMTEPITDDFEVEFLRHAPESGGSDEELSWDEPEVHEVSQFDIGELLIQQLSLAMDAFPRKEGATSLVEEYGQAGERSPFAILRGSFEKADEKQ